MKATPVTEFEWPAWNEIGPLHELACKNHPNLRWSTKHPRYRNIHYLGLADDAEITTENSKYMWQECECPYEDLLVIGKEQ